MKAPQTENQPKMFPVDIYQNNLPIKHNIKENAIEKENWAKQLRIENGQWRITAIIKSTNRFVGIRLD